MSSIQTVAVGAGAILVAAHDSSEAAQQAAGFVCDGDGDQVEIQAALDTLGEYGGHVSLAAGTFRISDSIHVNVEGTVLTGPGALISWSDVPASVPLISVNASNCHISSLRIRGASDRSSGIGIRLHGNEIEADAVNAVSVTHCRCENLAVGIEIGIVERGSTGDCTIYGARINRCGTGILSRGFTNRIFSPFISNVDIGIHQTTDRGSGSFQLYGATINNWTRQALLLERGRDFVIDSLWAEHTAVIDDERLAAGGVLEVVRLGSDEYEVVNPHFTGIQSFHLAEVDPAVLDQYVFSLVQCRGLVVEAVRLSPPVPTAIVFQYLTQTGTDNRIHKVNFGPNPIPDEWNDSHLIRADSSVMGEITIEQVPDIAGSVGGATVGDVAAPESDFVISRSPSGTYFAKHRSGNVPAFGTSLKHVLDAVLGSDRHIHFGPGRFNLGRESITVNELSNLTFSGAGQGLTTVVNKTDADADTEPFSFTRSPRCVVRDLTVIAGGSARTTSDALDFDGCNDCLVQRVEVVQSRGRGIVFDGKDDQAEALRNTVEACVVSGCSGSGFELLVTEHCTVTNCRSFNNGEAGLKVNRDSNSGRKSRFNRIEGGEFSENGQDGISVFESDFTTIEGARCMNNGRDGVRIEALSGGSLTVIGTSVTGCHSFDDRLDGAAKTQQFGINVADQDFSGRVIDSILNGNYLVGNTQAGLSDMGINTVTSANILG